MLQNIASYSCPCQRSLKRWTHWLNLKRTQYLNAEKKLCSANNQVVVAALSHYVKKHFQKHYHLAENRIAVVPNGINTKMRPDTETAQQLREKILNRLPVPKGKMPVFFFFAANNPRLKGIDSLLEAFKNLSRQLPAHEYPVVGDSRY